MKTTHSSFAIIYLHIYLILVFMCTGGALMAQQPSAACASCNRSSNEIAKSGHAPDCKYYTPPKSGSKPSPNNSSQGNDPLKILNDELDILLTPTGENSEKSNNDAKLKQEELLKKQEVQRARHDDGMKTFKSFDTKPTNKGMSGSATIKKCSGSTIEIKRNGEWQRIDCSAITNNSIAPNESIRTGSDSKLTLILPDSMLVQVNPNCEFKLANRDIFSLELLYGKIRFFCAKFHNKFEIRGPSAICGVRGTQLEIRENRDGGSEISLFEGEVEVETVISKEKIILLPGKKVNITAEGRIDSIEKIDVTGFIDSFEE